MQTRRTRPTRCHQLYVLLKAPKVCSMSSLCLSVYRTKYYCTELLARFLFLPFMYIFPLIPEIVTSDGARIYRCKRFTFNYRFYRDIWKIIYITSFQYMRLVLEPHNVFPTRWYIFPTRTTTTIAWMTPRNTTYRRDGTSRSPATSTIRSHEYTMLYDRRCGKSIFTTF